MKAQEILQSWSTILGGRKPLMSIEITRECPLRCPGCYAYDEAHLGGNGVTLRVLSDYKQDALVKGVLDLVDRYRPLHVSLVGGDPMVRYRELEQILPALESRGIHTQLVTSAFRPIPEHWSKLSRLNIVVSIDGLQPDHEARHLRAHPAEHPRPARHRPLHRDRANRPPAELLRALPRLLEPKARNQAHLDQPVHSPDRRNRPRDSLVRRAHPCRRRT